MANATEVFLTDHIPSHLHRFEIQLEQYWYIAFVLFFITLFPYANIDNILKQQFSFSRWV